MGGQIEHAIEPPIERTCLWSGGAQVNTGHVVGTRGTESIDQRSALGTGVGGDCPVSVFVTVILFSGAAIPVEAGEIVTLAPGWTATVVAAVDQSYVGWDVEIGDADNDGKNELVVATRSDNISEGITSQHLGHVFRYTLNAGGNMARQLLADLNKQYAESSWLAVGDTGNDGRNEVVLATGKGDRTQPGTSYVLLLEK